MSEAQAILFDLDGTLVDTRESNFLAYREAFQLAGHVLTREQFAGTWGADSRDFIPALIPGISRPAVDEIRARKADVFSGHLHCSRGNSALIEFARSMQDVVQIGLVTTAKASNVDAVLETHRLYGLFNVIVSGDDVRKPKPSPEGYLTALRVLGVEPSAAVAFEDSQTGSAAAAAAGILVVPVRAFDD